MVVSELRCKTLSGCLAAAKTWPEGRDGLPVELEPDPAIGLLKMRLGLIPGGPEGATEGMFRPSACGTEERSTCTAMGEALGYTPCESREDTAGAAGVALEVPLDAPAESALAAPLGRTAETMELCSCDR